MTSIKPSSHFHGLGAKASQFYSQNIGHETGVFWPRYFPTVMQGAIRIMRISPELFQEMLNRSISIVCPVRFMVNYDQFQTTDHTLICCGCVPVSTAIYGFLRSVAVDYRRNKISELVKNRATEKSRWQKCAS